VSIVKPGDFLLCDSLTTCGESLSTHPAGVGGTGPSDVTPLGGGRRVGGEITGVVLRSTLWTLSDRKLEGGGPGGGGGSGMPGSHLVCDVDRDRLVVGVSMAPVEAARRAAGGPGKGPVEGPATGRSGSGAYTVVGPMLRRSI
jgi:hypothetical protein